MQELCVGRRFLFVVEQAALSGQKHINFLIIFIYSTMTGYFLKRRSFKRSSLRNNLKAKTVLLAQVQNPSPWKTRKAPGNHRRQIGRGQLRCQLWVVDQARTNHRAKIKSAPEPHHSVSSHQPHPNPPTFPAAQPTPIAHAGIVISPQPELLAAACWSGWWAARPDRLCLYFLTAG